MTAIQKMHMLFLTIAVMYLIAARLYGV